MGGAELRSLNYPAASFLLVAPFVAAGSNPSSRAASDSCAWRLPG